MMLLVVERLAATHVPQTPVLDLIDGIASCKR